MSAAFRFPRFFMTNAGPCPYLPGKTERKVFTELSGEHASELNDALGRIGFRRSQNVAYRPSCADCTACVSVRIVASEFKPNATQRRLIKRNSDLLVTACKPWSTAEQFALLQRYLTNRHPTGGMTEMDEVDFADMVEQSPVDTFVIEYRERGTAGRPGKLVGACLTDRQGDGLSMIYSFFDPDPRATAWALAATSSSTMCCAPSVRACLMCISAIGVEGSERMGYKVRYRPIERLGRAGWERFEPESGEARGAQERMPAPRSAADARPRGATA